MIRIAICDDEEIIVSQIEEMIMDVCSCENISTNVDVFYSGESLVKAALSDTSYDLIYLDIQMKGENGITAAKEIRQIDENVLFVFVSGYDKYLMELFQLDVFSFLKKPIDEKHFTEIFLKANRKICDKNYYFIYRYKNAEYKIACKDILYFESSDRKIQINLRNGKSEWFYGKLSDVEAEMAAGKIPFLRLHQSYLVNYHQIKSRTKTSMTLHNEVSLPISEDRQKSFAKAYRELIRGEVNV